MNLILKARSIGLIIFFLTIPVRSQQLGTPNTTQLKLEGLRLHAIAMVRQTASEAALWDDKRASVYALANAADLLWDEAPGEGERWLRNAWEVIDQVSVLPRNEQLNDFFRHSTRNDLRTVVLSVARKHDVKLAESLLKQLSQKEPGNRKDRGAFDDRSARSEQLLQLAQQAVETNPEMAFSLAEASLDDGLSYRLQNVLTSLRKKNVEMANRLFDLALARFVSSEPEPSEAEILAGYLFQSGLTFSANSNGQTILVVNPAQQNLPAVATSEPQRAGRFLVAVYQAILARPISTENSDDKLRAQRILMLGNRIAGRYNTYAPDLAPAAQGFLSQLQSRLSPGSESMNPVDPTPRPPIAEASTKPLTKEGLYDQHISQLVEIADTESNPLFKKVAYGRAAVATKSEDYIRAKRIAAKIDDNDLRSDIDSFVLYRAALFFVEKNDVPKAVEIAPQIGDLSRRAVVKIAIAQLLIGSTAQKGESVGLTLKQQQAFDLLSDLDKEIGKEAPSAQMAKILLGRTAILARLDRAQGLAALEQAVQVINKLEKFDLRDSTAPELDVRISVTAGATVANPRIGFDFRSAIDPLITTDFEHIAAVVDRLTLKEVAGLGRLEAAKLFLQRDQVSRFPATLIPRRDLHR